MATHSPGRPASGLANLLAQFDGTADGRHDTAPQDGEQFQLNAPDLRLLAEQVGFRPRWHG